MGKIKAILFDMDGVLIDAKDWHYEALNKALRLFGQEITRYDHIHSFDGLPTKEKLNKISEASFLPKELHPFINQLKQNYTIELINEKCRPVFQHEYTLSKLKKEGYLCGVCSNSIRNTIIQMMEKARLLEYMDIILSNEDVKKAKPDPEIYVKAMGKLQKAPGECLIVEDNKNGIRAATESGGFVLQVNDVLDVNYHNIMSFIERIEEEDI